MSTSFLLLFRWPRRRGAHKPRVSGLAGQAALEAGCTGRRPGAGE